MKRPISIPVFWQTPDHITAEIVGREMKVSDSVVRTVTFFDPSLLAVAEYVDWKDGGHVYGLVMFGGEEFISPLTAYQLTEAVLSVLFVGDDRDSVRYMDHEKKPLSASRYVKENSIPEHKPKVK